MIPETGTGVVERLFISRMGQFSCPTRAGVLLLGNLKLGVHAARGVCLGLGGPTEAEIADDLLVSALD